MSKSIVPAVLTSAIVGLVAYKMYDDNKNTNMKENFVDYNLRSIRKKTLIMILKRNIILRTMFSH